MSGGSSPSEKPPPEAATSTPAPESLTSGEFGVAEPERHEVEQLPYGDSLEPGRPSWAEPWNFAGWGHAERLEFYASAPSAPPKVTRPHTKLGQWSATAICGNDITSSVLYVTALCTIVSGVYAPLIYFTVAMPVVTIMFSRITILKAFLYVGEAAQEKVAALNRALSDWTLGKVNAINAQSMVFFTRGDSPANLRRAIEYVLHNEQTRNLKVVHVYQNEEDIPKRLADQLRALDEIFPEIRIDFLVVKGRFGPELIQKLSAHLDVPQNYMFIGCPGDRFPHNLADLGGVRLIV